MRGLANIFGRPEREHPGRIRPPVLKNGSAQPRTVRCVERWTTPTATLLLMAATAPAAHAGPIADLNNTAGNVNSTVGNVDKA
jgi:hypothetical protein